MGVRLIVHENLSQYVTSHPDQLSLTIPLWIGTLSTWQRVVMFCGWGVKAVMVRVWVAGKTVWSTCYHKPYLSALRYDRAVARILFQPRQRGRLNRGAGGAAPSGVQGQTPDQGSVGFAPWSSKLFSSWMPKWNGKCTAILLFYDLFIIQQKCLKLHIYNNAVVKWHWTTICKTVRPMLSDRCHCLSVCRSVMLVYNGQTVAWIKMSLGMEVGLAPGHMVLGKDPALSRHFSARLLWPNGRPSR